jgi:peptidoglycan/LPS O-acetylase OafA/YrhL
MFETWYMAVDTQLFIIAPLFVYLLWRWEKTGLATLTVFTLSSLAANVAVFTFNDKFPPTIMPTRWQVKFGFQKDKHNPIAA